MVVRGSLPRIPRDPEAQNKHTQEIVDTYLDEAGRQRFSAGLVLFLEVGTTSSGYLQQRIGDNQCTWDKICILG